MHLLYHPADFRLISRYVMAMVEARAEYLAFLHSVRLITLIYDLKPAKAAIMC